MTLSELGTDKRENKASIENCRRLIEREIFMLRPEEYGDKYPIWPGSVGIEVEMLPLAHVQDPSNSKVGKIPEAVPLQGPDSLAAHLRDLAVRQNWEVIESKNSAESDTQVTRIALDQNDNLTFEPGGQLEFSSKPYPCFSDAVRRVRSVQTTLDQHFAAKQWHLAQVGANPWHSVDAIGLQMAKSRYQSMNRYFSQIGPYGQRMMRQTCTIQPCLDFGKNETEMAKRYLAGQLLSPFVTAMFANSPIIEGKESGFLSFRSLVWRELDPSRTGLPDLEALAKNLNKESCIQSYFDFALQANVVFIEALSYEVPKKTITFSTWIKEGYKGVFPNVSDFAEHVSLLFPEVRPRGFLEFRSVDSQARVWQMVPVAFYLGLIYDPQKLDSTIDLLLPYAKDMDQLLRKSADGLAHPEFADICPKLMELALEGFSRLPPCFRGEGSEQALKRYSETFTIRGKTPADHILERFRQSGLEQPSFSMFQLLEEEWQSQLI